MQWGIISSIDQRNGKWRITTAAYIYISAMRHYTHYWPEERDMKDKSPMYANAMRRWHERLSLTSWRVEELRCGDGCWAVEVVSSRQHIEEAGGNCFGAAAATWVEYVDILTPHPWRKRKSSHINYSKINANELLKNKQPPCPPPHPNPPKRLCTKLFIINNTQGS